MGHQNKVRDLINWLDNDNLLSHNLRVTLYKSDDGLIAPNKNNLLVQIINYK